MPNSMDVTSRRLAALFCVGLLAFFSPILGAFNRPLTVFGLPILPFYLFSTWAGLVGLSWLLVRKGRR